VGSLNKIKKVSSRLEQKYERAPSLDEIAKTMDMPEHKLDKTMQISLRYISTDAPISSEDDTKFLDMFISDDIPKTDSTLMRESLNKEIQRSLSTLTEKERDVINLYYGIGMNHGLTLEEIGAKFNLTRERVRQIKEKAIRRLKHTARSRLLKAYLGE
jgi:RNA polymerase primary sigma factor